MNAPPDPKVIALAALAQDVIEITELEPYDGTFCGKLINHDGALVEYTTNLTYWRQGVACVPATIPHLFAHLCEARSRNICLIRGAPANLDRQPTRRLKAGRIGSQDRGDHGFIDKPTRLFFLDPDGVPLNWRGDPEQAIQDLVAQLGEPWASTSFVWFFSAKHGLEWEERIVEHRQRDGKVEEVKRKHWTGNIIDGKIYARIGFITERALNDAEAGQLTKIAKVSIPKLDTSLTRCIQPNYIKRPRWIEHPDRDVLGNIPTIGWVRGVRDYLAVPDNLTSIARVAQAQGHNANIAEHPNAEAAVKGIGSDGHLREHMTSAVVHLLRANPIPEVVSFDDHSLNITDKLQAMIEQHREQITSNLAVHGRHWGEVHGYIAKMPNFAGWCLDHPGILRAKTIKLVKEDRAEAKTETTCEAIFARVKRTIECSRKGAVDNETPVVELLVAPTGSRKSTLIRAAAVQYVTEQPNKTVVILMPRHKLGAEQIEMLQQEHPGGNYSTAVWRGRHAWDANAGNGREQKMCQRSKEAEAIEEALLDVDSNLCKQGRGEKTIKCPFYDGCAYQQQKQTKANIWFAAHECAVHEKQTAFGDVGWVIFDESPLDAFMFGTDSGDQVTLELDTLRTPLPVNRENRAKFKGRFNVLMRARKALYHVLDKLRVPIDSDQGAAVQRQKLKSFIDKTKEEYYARYMCALTWPGKVEPKIRPDMSDEQVKSKLKEAAGNATIKKESLLWDQVAASANNVNNTDKLTPEERMQLLEVAAANNNKAYGRVQVHRGKGGRVIRMVGLKQLAKGWDVQTLICDATGDAELLKAIWPQLVEAEPHGWEQLPRPPNVRVFQCVDRTISKWAVAVEDENPKELARKVEGARQLYTALLMKALEYGGADVGVIVYKSTRDWIEKNCRVPEWMRIVHWGDITGTNALRGVRALFVVGRPLAPAEAVTRQAEALFGVHIPQREYVKRYKRGHIPITPDASGNNCTLVDVQEHPDPMGERLRRQITEGAIIQAAGRARAGLRTANEPLDLHLWTDVPVPELGAVEWVLWSELKAGLDGLMLALEGVWLRNIFDAARAFDGLFSADGLKTARRGGRLEEGFLFSFWTRGVGVLHIGTPIYKTPTPVFRVNYQRAAPGCKLGEAVFLKEVANPRAWLEERLGPLAYFEVQELAA